MTLFFPSFGDAITSEFVLVNNAFKGEDGCTAMPNSTNAHIDPLAIAICPVAFCQDLFQI